MSHKLLVFGIIIIVGLVGALPFLTLDSGVTGAMTAVTMSAQIVPTSRFLITPNTPSAERGVTALGISVHRRFMVRGKPAFTADVPLHLLNRISAIADVRPVKLLHIQPPRGGKCGDGICQGFESASTCPGDCGSGGGDTSGRTSFPDDQTPWGIEKIYNNPSITVTSGGAGVDVAILDTGASHMDLARRLRKCKDFTRKTITNKCADKHGHGTHVAGTVLADGAEDGKGIYGVAPEAGLFAYKVCKPNGSCWADDIAAAMRDAADNGAEIISMSLGGIFESELIRDGVTYAVSKGLLVVAAAGNSGPNLNTIIYPAANPDAIAVAAIDSSETVAIFSSRGINDGDSVIEAREIEVAAPGVNVESTTPGGGYSYKSGTSMATPHISGLAAKIWASGVADANFNGITTAAEVRTYLQNRAKLHDITKGIYAGIGEDPASGLGLPQVS